MIRFLLEKNYKDIYNKEYKIKTLNIITKLSVFRRENIYHWSYYFPKKYCCVQLFCKNIKILLHSTYWSSHCTV